MRKTVSCHSERSEESAAVMREEKQGLYKFITAILLINLPTQDLCCLSKPLFYFEKILLCFFPMNGIFYIAYYFIIYKIVNVISFGETIIASYAMFI
jgi:hypothetical protein